MIENARRALRIETEFLAGAESNFERAKGRQLCGTSWQTTRGDEVSALRALLASRGHHDTALLRHLPRNRRIVVRGFQRRWWFGKRLAGVSVASVLTPLEHVAAGSEGRMPPIDLGELVDHVRAQVANPEVPHLVGVCGPSGFTDEARNSQLDLPNVTLVLIEPRAGGGWRVTGVRDDIPEQILSLFDPEATSQKLDRVRREIDQRRADLPAGGLSAGALAARLDLPENVVVEAFEQAALAEPELKISRKSGDVLLVRGAPAVPPSKPPASVIERIRALFDRAGEEAEKIGLLAEQRVGLAQRRDRVYEDITGLERKEAELLEQGRRTPATSARRRLARKLAQLRKDIARRNTIANMLNTQIEIVAAHIHNLTLIQQGRMVELPDTAELTQHAVRAEELLEGLQADADLAASLDERVAEIMTSAEEEAILAEFETAAGAETPGQMASPEAAPAEEEDAPRRESDKHRPPREESEA